MKKNINFRIKQKEIDNFEYIFFQFKADPNYFEKYKLKKRTHTEYMKDYLKNDTNRLKHNLRSRFYNFLKKGYKKSSVIDLLGCSLEEFKIHLKNQFTEGMSWENYGDWEVDHILPLNDCDCQDKNDLKKYCNYKNLQPLWKSDNRKKSKNIR